MVHPTQLCLLRLQLITLRFFTTMYMETRDSLHFFWLLPQPRFEFEVLDEVVLKSLFLLMHGFFTCLTLVHLGAVFFIRF